jgi:hypothetical protein
VDAKHQGNSADIGPRRICGRLDRKSAIRKREIMENITFAIEDDSDEAPILIEGTAISIMDEITEGSFVLIVPNGENAVEIHLAHPASLKGDEKVYVVTRGEEPGQIVFIRAKIELEGTSNLEAQLEAMYTDVSWYYRDFDLPTDLTDRYAPGLIIVERGFTDASKHRGGFAASHRYLIASPAATDLSESDETDPDRGLCVMQSGGYFRVLDVTDDGDRRQTTLLHMPEFLAEILDGNEFTNFEHRLIAQARHSFAELIDAPPIEALTKVETWLDRLQSPLGMDDNGQFFRN